ncbi:MAG TPA: NAD-dependent epimerase/dehydratase family protein [bacterium]|jgi:dihydroflavonol-4-reductase
MNRLLITGATGFIGQKLTRHYKDSAWSVRLLVRDLSRIPTEVKGFCEICQGDLTKPDTLSEAVKGVDAIIHSAGLLGQWGMPYRQLFEVNVGGVGNLVRAAAAAGVKRFVHLSAGGVTGPLKVRVVDESYSPAPRTDYERSKWEGEQLALNLSKELNLNLIVVRPTFTYGPGDPHKIKLFQAIKKGRFFFIGDGFSTIHPVFIDDLIAGIDLALKSDIRAETIIVGGDCAVSKRELVWSIAAALGSRKPEMRIPIWLGEALAKGCEWAADIFGFSPPLTQSRMLMLSRNWGYSIKKARKLLGYNPKIDLREGLRLTVQWYREQGWL